MFLAFLCDFQVNLVSCVVCFVISSVAHLGFPCADMRVSQAKRETRRHKPVVFFAYRTEYDRVMIAHRALELVGNVCSNVSLSFRALNMRLSVKSSARRCSTMCRICMTCVCVCACVCQHSIMQENMVWCNESVWPRQ